MKRKPDPRTKGAATVRRDLTHSRTDLNYSGETQCPRAEAHKSRALLATPTPTPSPLNRSNPHSPYLRTDLPSSILNVTTLWTHIYYPYNPGRLEFQLADPSPHLETPWNSAGFRMKKRVGGPRPASLRDFIFYVFRNSRL